MDTAASVIAVVQITEQVLTLCYDYAKGVKDAPVDISRLQDELESLEAILKGATDLLKGPYKDRLQASQKLSRSVEACASELDKLKAELVTKSGDLHQHRFSRSRLKWPLEKKEAEKILRSFQQHRNNLSASLTIDHTAISLEHFERMEDDERLTILEWMSPIQYGKNHTAVKEKRTPNTCEWLIQTKLFRDWETKDTSMVLWLHGIPGAGKTYLTSRVIDHIQSRLHDDPSKKEGFAFFYCNRNEEERRKPLSIFQSYARQLAAVAGQPKLVQKHLRGLWQESRSRGQDLGMEQCKTQILNSIEFYDKTTIVLDALDECELESRIFIMKTIKTLLARVKKPFCLFISSRPEGDIRKLFNDFPNIEIQATDNSDDIKKFVHEEIVEHSVWKDIPTILCDEIETTLLNQSQGMFQWAYLQIKQLLEQKTQSAMRNRLGKLPESLKAAYDEIYDEIASGDRNDKAIADRAFKWVACAADPLSNGELLEAVRWDPEDSENLSDEVDQATLLSICKNLLVFDSSRGVWRFSHLSVTEYFESHHWTLVQAHCDVAKVCLSFLMGSHNISGMQSREPFACYTHMNWVVHVRKQEGLETQDSVHSCRLKKFLGSPTKSSEYYHHWFDNSTSHCRVRWDLMRIADDEWMPISSISPPDHNSLIICRASFFNVLKDWWNSSEVDLSQISIDGETTLVLAAESGSRPICDEIVKRGCDVNQQGGQHGSALAAAVYYGHEEIVQHLIDLGADVNAMLQSTMYGSALAAASGRNHTGICQTLCRHGADMNMVLQTGCYGSALVAAAASSKLSTIRFLCELGADVNLTLQCGCFGSALEAAACSGELEVVQYLVGRGANINHLSDLGIYGSALAASATWGRTDIIEYLIQNGALVDARLKCGHVGTALTAASEGRPVAAVQLLLANDASISMLPEVGIYGSPLVAAALGEVLDIVRILVENGADIDQQLICGDYGSPLCAAAAKGDIETAKYLIEKGADVNHLPKVGIYGSALAAAIRHNKDDFVEFLLQEGADVDLRLLTGDYKTAMEARTCKFASRDVFGEALKVAKLSVQNMFRKHAETQQAGGTV